MRGGGLRQAEEDSGARAGSERLGKGRASSCFIPTAQLRLGKAESTGVWGLFKALPAPQPSGAAVWHGAATAEDILSPATAHRPRQHLWSPLQHPRQTSGATPTACSSWPWGQTRSPNKNVTVLLFFLLIWP